MTDVLNPNPAPGVEISVMSSKEATSHAVEDAKAGYGSFMIWENMDHAKQDLLVKKVTDTLQRLIKQSKTWIPLSLELDGKNVININMKILLESIDEDEMMSDLKNIADRSTAIEELRDIEESLRA